jgi:hypothetical protein
MKVEVKKRFFKIDDLMVKYGQVIKNNGGATSGKAV